MRLAKKMPTNNKEAKVIKVELVYGLSKTILCGRYLYEEGNFQWPF